MPKQKVVDAVASKITRKQHARAALDAQFIGDALIPRRVAYREYLGIGNTTGWRRERDDPDFPVPVSIGPMRWGFRLSELQAYIANRPRREGQS